jgi:hypothetical protein
MGTFQKDQVFAMLIIKRVSTIVYADWPPLLARLTLLVLVLLVVYGFVIDVEPLIDTSKKTEEQTSDLDLYRAVVERLQAGESFYAANGDEQHQRGYPTKPFLTWRLPTVAWVISYLGEDLATNLLWLLASLAVLAWVKPLKEAGLGRIETICGAFLVYFGLMIVFMVPLVYLHESWAVVLITLSLPLRQRWWRLSVFLGLAALAFRELALPYVLVMAVCAWCEGHKREATWWAMGMLVFTLGLALHAWVVSGYIGSEARLSAGWLAMGGWAFLLKANQWNTLIEIGGVWLLAIWVPLAVLGAGSRYDSLGLRLFLIVAGYSAAFLFVGRGDNAYWGILYSPLMALSLVFVPSALRALWSAACGRSKLGQTTISG